MKACKGFDEYKTAKVEIFESDFHIDEKKYKADTWYELRGGQVEVCDVDEE